MTTRKLILPMLLCAFLVLPACSWLQGNNGSNPDVKANYPRDPDDLRRERDGKLNGEAGLFHFGGDNNGGGGNGPHIGVNSYLWRAALDTLSFMPLASADPFGGTIITDWYEDPQAKGSRYKANVVILGSVLRVDAVRVTVFKELLDDHGSWRETSADPKLARELEDKILTAARQLRVNQPK